MSACDPKRTFLGLMIRSAAEQFVAPRNESHLAAMSGEIVASRLDLDQIAIWRGRSLSSDTIESRCRSLRRLIVFPCRLHEWSRVQKALKHG